MNVIVNKKALISAIVESLSNETEPEFERIDVVNNTPKPKVHKKSITAIPKEK